MRHAEAVPADLLLPDLQEQLQICCFQFFAQVSFDRSELVFTFEALVSHVCYKNCEEAQYPKPDAVH
jgi:hypothetical protein